MAPEAVDDPQSPVPALVGRAAERAPSVQGSDKQDRLTVQTDASHDTVELPDAVYPESHAATQAVPDAVDVPHDPAFAFAESAAERAANVQGSALHVKDTVHAPAAQETVELPDTE